MTELIAIDLGNESGRVMGVNFNNGKISSHEIYRFSNNLVMVRGRLYWDALRLWYEVTQGLEKAITNQTAGIAVDTCGVDFGLIDSAGRLLDNPVHHRDSRTEGMVEWVTERVPRETIFERTAIGFYVINTLYQLAYLSQNRPWLLDNADTLLTIPNLYNYWLTGEKFSEFTHSTTTQCYNPYKEDWDRETLGALNIPTDMLPQVVMPGERVGFYQDVPVFAVASHDTGSAVVAVPTETPNFAYISSGTWSLFGLETRQAINSPAALDANLTSEGGAFGTFRPLKMVMGLWLLQQCRANWQGTGIDTDYESLVAQAEAAPSFKAFIDPDDPVFFTPGDMPARIREFCENSNQTSPDSPGEFVRCILESLALKYRFILDQLIQVIDQPVDVIHVVGGGSQNQLLCQMTADATARPVLAGPVEASSLGNGLVQLIALGELSNLAEAREVVRLSLPPVRYEPQNRDAWEAAYNRFKGIMTTEQVG